MSARPAIDRSPHPYYEILEECGHGGMGVVYRAVDKRLNRTVALKFLLDARAAESDDAIKRFRREAESIAALNHPNIATLYEVGEWDGKPFLAMEFLPGGSLSGRRQLGGIDSQDLFRFATQLGRGLHFAHTRGILHRDVKPGNAMFSDHGALKLVDFGLAKPADSHDITHTGTSVGTVAYMAPELIRGEEATVATDIYAFGAMLYDLAAGHAMFTAKNLAALADQVLRSPRVPLLSVCPRLFTPLAEAIDRAVAVDPKDRFDSVGEFLAHIGSSDEISFPTQTLTTLRTGPRPSRARKRYPLFIAIGALLLALVVSAALYFKGRHARPADLVLVVLPFENLGGDPANQPLCDGLQETVTGLLSRASASYKLLVVPSSELRRAQVATIAQARRQFKADMALTGSAQRNADRLILNLNLDDAVLLKQKDARRIFVGPSDTDLQEKLAQNLASLFGFASLQGSTPPPPGEITSSSTAYSLYLEGAGVVETHHPDAAIGYLARALQLDPHFALARAKLAEAYLWKNTLTTDPKWLVLADAEVNRASEGGAGHETLMAKAMIKRATGDLPAAIALFEQIVKTEPGNVEACQLLARTLAAANRPAEAEATLQRGIGLRPGYWPLQDALGVFLMDRGQYPKAERAFQAALALAPDEGLVYNNLGVLYFSMNRLTEAAASFETSLKKAPGGLAHSNLATIYFYKRQYQDAVRHALAATEFQPVNPVNWGNLGDARWQLPSQRKAALQAFAQAASLSAAQLSINPGNVRVRKSYALYLAKLGRTGEAVSQIELALSQAPADRNVRFYAARVFAVAGETDKAMTALDKCRALGFSQEEIEREPDLAALSQRRK